MGAAKVMCQAPLFSAKTLTISNTQPIAKFYLATTLCKNGGTPKVMVKSNDIFYNSPSNF
jgi:hypothetical protein